MGGVAITELDRGRAVWRRRLGSAFRTALACSIVGCATLYGPEPLRHRVPYPAFSYVTAILIVSDSTYGDALRGCYYALYATVLVLPLSILALWVIGPARFSEGGAALAVVVSAFLVAVPESISLMTKRIGFGQIVIVYVGTVVHGSKTGVVMHPAHIAASTALGALASLLAMLFPYPRLAFHEVRKLLQLYTENASERTNLFMKALFCQDNSTAYDLISQAKPFTATGTKLLHQINLIQEGVRWERPRMGGFENQSVDRFQDMETMIRGMELALTSITQFPVSMINQNLRSVLLQGADAQEGLKLEHTECFLQPDSTTVPPESKAKLFDKFLQSLATSISPNLNNLPAFFFLSCMQLLLTNSGLTPKNLENSTKESRPSEDQANFSLKRMLKSLNVIVPTNKGLVFALKCSLSLGLAVLLGLLFDKENGYWSGLTIAISFATERQPTFTMANARVQGTALGSVYGVLGCFVLHKFTDVRFVVLLPWIVFTSFLRHSKMYGQAGGISAVIGALLILGRKNYGLPDEFAIARLTEASIGLLSLIVVELLLQPAARAATLTKDQLSQCLGTLTQCIQQVVLCVGQNEKRALTFLALKENQKKLKSNVNSLKKFIGDAESEPDFWFGPFPASCHNKLHKSLSRMVDLLEFMVYSLDFLLKGCVAEELQEKMKSDLELLKEKISPRLNRLEKIALIRSIKALEQRLQEGKRVHDLESGKPHTSTMFGVNDDAGCSEVLNSFLQHSKEMADKIQHCDQGEDEFNAKTILHLNCLGFCISGLMTETTEVEKGIKDLVRWENPSRRVDFHELCCMIDAVYQLS